MNHNVVCYGYTIEIDRAGKFDLERALSQEIPKQYWKHLQKGETIESDGKTYTPEMVLGAPRKGLKLTYCTDTRPTNSIRENAKGSDLFICEGMYALKDRFIQGVTRIEDVRINGLMGRDSAPHVVSVSIGGIRSEVLLHSLEDRGICVSAGSACSAHKATTSSTLQAIGVEKKYLDSTLRFSFSVFTTQEEIDYTLQQMYDMIPMLRRYTRH